LLFPLDHPSTAPSFGRGHSRNFLCASVVICEEVLISSFHSGLSLRTQSTLLPRSYDFKRFSARAFSSSPDPKSESATNRVNLPQRGNQIQTSLPLLSLFPRSSTFFWSPEKGVSNSGRVRPARSFLFFPISQREIVRTLLMLHKIAKARFFRRSS